MNNLEKSILHTLSFFSAQDLAVSLLELHNLLIRVSKDQQPARVGELRDALSGLVPGKVASQAGLFTLPNRPDLFERRHFTYINTMKLFQKANRWATFLRHIPYVRAVCISGSTAQMNSSDESDIDLFIIVEPKRIFLARVLVSLYFQLLGMRRHADKVVERFCLNHYIICDLVILEDRNHYTAMLYSSFLTLFGRSYVEEFWKANLFWIQKYFLQAELPSSHVFEKAESPQSIAQKVLEIIFRPISGILERLTGFYQRNRIHESEYVTVSVNQLSFHPDSKGQRILSKYQHIAGQL